MDRAAFLRRALEIIKEARPFDASVIDEDRFAVVSIAPDGASRMASLDNFWSEYTSADSPRAREAVLERIARFATLIDSGESFDEIRVLLMPRIRARATFEVDLPGAAASIHRGPRELPRIFHRPLAGHLGVGLAIDRPDHIEYITDVSGYALSGDELLDVAVINLRRATRSGLEKKGDGLWVGEWGDSFAPERVLLDELFRDLPAGVIVFLPGPEQIYVVDPEERSALVRALALVDERLERPRGLVPFALRRRDGEWRVVDDPEFPVLGERLTAYLAPYYQGQCKAQEAAAESGRSVDPPFFANLVTIPSERGDGRLVTAALWSKGQDVLLPRTDVLYLTDLDRQSSTIVTWQRFMRICGDCIAPASEEYPFRHRTLAFPSDESFAELRKVPYEPRLAKEPVASREAEEPFRPLTEPEAPERVDDPAWSALSGRSIVFFFLGLGTLFMICRLLDRLYGCN